MGKRKHRKGTFRVGKGIKPTDKGHAPLVGAPNSNLDTYYKESGKLHQRRKFGADGQAVKDYDAANFRHDRDHVHDFNGTIRGKNSRDLTKQERREFEKAKRKRRVWNHDKK